MATPSDRAKRKSILTATRVLPRRLRIAARYRLLSQLEWGRGRRAEVLIIGHPKSGTTWLRVMLSHLYQQRYDLPRSILIKSDELSNLDVRVPVFLITNGHYSYEAVIGAALSSKQSAAPFRAKKVVLLARHPCDIAVSWYFQFTKRISTPKRELINATLERPIDFRTVPMWDFVMQSEIGLPSIVEFLNRWERNLSNIDRPLLVRYEDLRAQPIETLRRVVSFLDEDFSESEVRSAVEFGSFENLRTLESAGFFRRGGLSRRDPADPETAKVRRGKVHGYRDYFTPEQAAEMEALVVTRLSPAFGYAKLDSDSASA
jgi:hypothetical protein